MMALSSEQEDAYTSGSMITRMTNDTKVVTEFSGVFVQTVIKPLMLFIFGIVMVLVIDKVYGIILLVSLPLQILIMYYFIKRSSPVFRTIQQKLDKLNSAAIHIVSNNRLIKAYVREGYEVGRFDQKNRDLTDTIMRIQIFMAILNPLVMLILNGVVLAVIFIGGFQVQAKTIQVGSIMAAINYSQMIMMSMMTLGGIFQFISRSRVSAERLSQVLDTDPALKSGEKKLTSSIESIRFDNVCFRYPQNKDAVSDVLDHVSLSANASWRGNIPSCFLCLPPQR